MKALICGVGGQDGAYLSRLLLDKGYEVIGASRDAMASTFFNLKRLDIRDKVVTTSMAITDFRSVIQTLDKYQPDEVYNLAGQSSVGLSFEQPVETMESIAIGTLNMLEAIRFYGKPIRFYSAGSSECFGDTGTVPASEETPFRPRSPYAVAKATAHNLVANYREAYSLYACTGILFNHESPLRPERFVTQKIVRTAARIASGDKGKLEMGNINIQRDWGWAPEYVEAMWKMLQLDQPQDFVIATGRTVSLEFFIEHAFRFFGLDYKDHLVVNPNFFRPTDIHFGASDPSRASDLLDWRAQVKIETVIENMCIAARNLIQTPSP
ncbi:MAG: GDP-mannose 4,6-dehydratase [Thiobacillus sp.]